eukprot:m.343189 g.343189  ORF g.343189 m.343189 type:complete len:781 (+) comp22449_c0_seq1:331-2673(+)
MRRIVPAALNATKSNRLRYSGAAPFSLFSKQLKEVKGTEGQPKFIDSLKKSKAGLNSLKNNLNRLSKETKESVTKKQKPAENLDLQVSFPPPKKAHVKKGKDKTYIKIDNSKIASLKEKLMTINATQPVTNTKTINKAPPQFQFDIEDVPKNENKKGKRSVNTEVIVQEGIKIEQLVNRMQNVKLPAVLRTIQELDDSKGWSAESTLNVDLAELIVADLGFEAIVKPGHILDEYPRPFDKSLLKVRPPVVTIMGHVDHGKTSLLDAFRDSSIAEGEAGGITQHIGAFVVNMATGGRITFLDTPGHAAFSAMRKRGSMTTDIVVLVVAADDGVMPQTKESINFAKEAGVPIVVAINKCDKHNADVENVVNGLAAAGLELEKLGGDVPTVEISALKKLNLDELEETITTVAEIHELKAEMSGPAEGTVIEVRNRKAEGPIATVLVRRGCLRVGDILVVGKTHCKVKSLRNDKSEVVKKAFPSEPVEVSGWDDVPMVGDVALFVDNEQRAREVSEFRKVQTEMDNLAQARISRMDYEKDAKARKDAAVSSARDQNLSRRSDVRNFIWKETLDRANEAFEDTTEEIALILKADVVGSEEVVTSVIEALSNEHVSVKVVKSGVGEVTIGDITLAEEMGVPIITFNLPKNQAVDTLADKHGVSIQNHKVIYELMQSLQEKVAAKMPVQEVVLGSAIVKQIFQLKGSKKATVAGSSVKSGAIHENQAARVVRNGEIIHRGPIVSLRHLKEDVSKVDVGMECGISLKDFDGLQQGDLIEVYEDKQLGS